MQFYKPDALPVTQNNEWQKNENYYNILLEKALSANFHQVTILNFVRSHISC